jgi:hypothetical protein
MLFREAVKAKVNITPATGSKKNGKKSGGINKIYAEITRYLCSASVCTGKYSYLCRVF